MEESQNPNILNLARLRRQDLLVFGCRVSLMDLSSLQFQLGERWPRLRIRIDTFIQNRIAQTLTSLDTFFTVDELTYVIVFSSHDADTAHATVAQLRHTIIERLFGRDGLISEGKLAIGFGILAADDLDLGSDALDRKLAGFEPEIYAATNDAAVTPAPADILTEIPLTERISVNLAKLENQVGTLNTVPVHRQSLNSAAYFEALHAASAVLAELKRDFQILGSHNLTKTPQRSTTYSQDFAGGTLQERFDNLKAQVLNINTQVIGVNPTSLAFIRKQLLDHAPTVQFAPILDTTKGLINSYLFGFDWLESVGIPNEIGHGMISQDAQFANEISQLSVVQAIENLTEAANNGHRQLVVIPVHYTVFSKTSSRRQFLELCETIPETLRDLIVWEFWGLDTISWLPEIAVYAKYLDKFGRACVTRMPLYDSYPLMTRKLPLYCLAGVIEPNIADRQLKVQLAGFCAFARRNNFVPALWGVPDSTLLEYCQTLKIRYLTGPAIGAPLSQLQGIQRLAKPPRLDQQN